MSDKKTTPTISNKKAYHDYHIEETFEAGLVLQGTEVKSLRAGKASFTDAFAFIRDGEVFLRELYIKPYEQGSYYNHDPRRPRKLLLNKKEIQSLEKGIQQKGNTLIPLKIYFKGGYAKLSEALRRRLYKACCVAGRSITHESLSYLNKSNQTFLKTVKMN